MLLKDLCTLEAACCPRDATITAAARLMQRHHAGDLVILDDLVDTRKPAGLITDRDIVVRVIAEGLDPDKATVGEHMTSPVVMGLGREDVAAGLERMHRHGVRRLPIIDERDRLIGIVTLDDLLREHAERAQDLLAIITKEQTRERRGAA